MFIYACLCDICAFTRIAAATRHTPHGRKLFVAPLCGKGSSKYEPIHICRQVQQLSEKKLELEAEM